MFDTSHLPPNVQKALADYDARVKDGAITFGSEGFADSYDGEQESDASLATWVRANVHQAAM